MLFGREPVRPRSPDEFGRRRDRDGAPRCWPGPRRRARSRCEPRPRPTPLRDRRPTTGRWRCATSTAVVDTSWRRTSYTALSRRGDEAAAAAGVASEPEVLPREDETWRPGRADRAGDVAGRAAPSARCPRRWPTCPVGATFGYARPRGARARRPGRPRADAELRAELPRASPSSWSGGPRSSTARSSPTPWSLSAHAARAARRGRDAAPGSPGATGSASWTSSCRWPAATSGTAGAALLAPRRPRTAAAPAPPAGGPGAAVRRRARRSRCWRAAAARLPHRIVDVVLRRADSRFLVVDYKTNWLGAARPTADRRGLPRRRWPRR